VAGTETRDSVANPRRHYQLSAVEFLTVALLIGRYVKKDENDAGNKGKRHE
jgi:hypothetical protein